MRKKGVSALLYSSLGLVVSRDQALTPGINRELYLPEHHTFVARGDLTHNREGVHRSSIAQLKQC